MEIGIVGFGRCAETAGRLLAAARAEVERLGGAESDPSFYIPTTGSVAPFGLNERHSRGEP